MTAEDCSRRQRQTRSKPGESSTADQVCWKRGGWAMRMRFILAAVLLLAISLHADAQDRAGQLHRCASACLSCGRQRPPTTGALLAAYVPSTASRPGEADV